MKKMTVEEFREYCKQFDENLSVIMTSFSLRCLKCNSENVSLLHNNHEYGMGSLYTGVYTAQNEEIVIKCAHCGNANVLKGRKWLEEENEKL